MRRLIKKFRPLLALLLLIQATSVYALPEDLHLNLCFGPDGHLKLSSDFCPESLLIEQLQPLNSSLSDDDHHGDCLDIVLNCDSEEELFSPSELTLLARTEIIGNCPPLEAEGQSYVYPSQIVQPSILNPGLINRASHPAHLGFISSTVLLI